jgi:hypothetical protein
VNELEALYNRKLGRSEKVAENDARKNHMHLAQFKEDQTRASSEWQGVLVSVKGDYEAKMAGLVSDIEGLKSQSSAQQCSFDAKVAEIKKNCQTMMEALTDTHVKRNEELSSQIWALKKEKSRLSKALAEREKKDASQVHEPIYQAKLEKMQEENDELEASLAKSRREVEGLRQQLEERKKGIVGANKEIQELKFKSNEEGIRMEALQDDLKQREDLIIDLRKELCQRKEAFDAIFQESQAKNLQLTQKMDAIKGVKVALNKSEKQLTMTQEVLADIFGRLQSIVTEENTGVWREKLLSLYEIARNNKTVDMGMLEDLRAKADPISPEIKQNFVDETERLKHRIMKKKIQTEYALAVREQKIRRRMQENVALMVNLNETKRQCQSLQMIRRGLQIDNNKLKCVAETAKRDLKQIKSTVLVRMCANAQNLQEAEQSGGSKGLELPKIRSRKLFPHASEASHK